MDLKCLVTLFQRHPRPCPIPARLLVIELKDIHLTVAGETFGVGDFPTTLNYGRINSLNVWRWLLELNLATLQVANGKDGKEYNSDGANYRRGNDSGDLQLVLPNDNVATLILVGPTQSVKGVFALYIMPSVGHQ